jgi:hypothetical protein
MANVKRPFGKDTPERFIDSALTGGSGPSNEIVDKKIDRPNQSINTAFAMDNVKSAMPIESSIKDEGGFAGGIDNLKHSLSGTGAVNEEIGAAGKTKSTIFPDH